MPALHYASSSTMRLNEHLAVLLPKHMWKPDSASSSCDNFYCRVPFSLFERRHHCRKCGGCFCNACTPRTTPLLDTSNLPFVYPPRNRPIADFASEDSPILDARVCDDCFDQLRGVSRSPTLKPTTPISRDPSDASLSSRSSDSPLSSAASSPTRRRTRSLRLRASSPASTSSLRSTLSHPPRTRTTAAAAAPLPLSLEKSYGELDAYPLKRSSVLCKATGGGRWEPTPITVLDGYRKPVVGGKAPWELIMEAEEEEERRRRENPVVVDGEFRYRWVVGRRD